MRVSLLVSTVAALALTGCGGGSDTSPVSLPTTTPSPAPGPAPSPTPTASQSTLNDGLVLEAAAPSLDSAIYLKRTYQGVPSLARVGNRIWTVWFGDNTSVGWESTGNYLILSYSDDDGDTWSREYYLVPANRSTDRTLDPRLWLAPDGKMWVIYAQAGGGHVFDGQLGVWANIISDPLAKDPTFEPGFWISDGLPNRPFLYRGAWYLPVDYLTGMPVTRFRERAGKHIYAFDWANRRAKKISTVPKTPNADFNESTYVELRNGRLYAQSRSYDGIYHSTSEAVGSLQFSSLARWTFYPSVPSRHQIARSPSGRLVMVWNESTRAGRTDMAVAFSDDDGATWPYVHVFDSRTEISYPDLDFAANGDLLIAFDRGRASSKEIWLTRIRENSIVQGTPDVITKLVNRAVKP